MAPSKPNMSHTWLPSRTPQSSRLIAILLVFCSMITSTTFGYDGSMLNGLNILPSYTDYFQLTPATTGLQTASVFIGGCLSLLWGPVTDKLGRRPALLWAAVVTLLAVILQTAAQNVAMFTIARILIGLGTGASGLAGPVYLAETLPLHWRGWGLGFFNDCYYVGGLIAAGVTYGTAPMASTWAWRIPSAIQGLFSIICILILPFIPESPRWLAHRGHHADALAVVAQTYADGDTDNPIVLAAFKEIVDTLEYERSSEQKLTLLETVKTPSARKRLTLACSAAVFSTIAGNVIASYYLGSELNNAGITSTTTQLQINVILNAWCLVVAVGGTACLDRLGRKTVAIISTVALTGFLFIIGALTKVYGSSTNNSGIYGTVAAVFLFQGAYSFGWTPLLYLYPPEVLNYPIRANGMGVFQFVANATAVLIVFTMPIAIAQLGWKLYMINGAWDVVMVGLIVWFWVETKGRTLEEIDAIFEGAMHSDVPDLELIYRGKEKVPSGVVEEVKALKVG